MHNIHLSCFVCQVVEELQGQLSRLSEEVGERDAECVGLRTDNVKLRMEVGLMIKLTMKL